MSAIPVSTLPLAANEPQAPTLEAVLPVGIAQAVWRGSALGRPVVDTVPSGWAVLDAELPGGGWPCRSVTEILTAQPAVLEWRLLGPGLRPVVDTGGQIVVVGPPRHPHLPGLQHLGLSERQFIWIQAEAPAERLWCTEQLVKSGACGALVAWLPQARPEQIRRLQVCAQACEGPVFLFRPGRGPARSLGRELRVMATFALDWEIQVQRAQAPWAHP
jgi:protein ImuA